MDHIKDLLQFLDNSPVNFLATETICQRLVDAGFERLNACEKLDNIKPGRQFSSRRTTRLFMLSALALSPLAKPASM